MRTARRRKRKHTEGKSIYYFASLIIIGSVLGTIASFLLRYKFLKTDNLCLLKECKISDFFIICFKYIKLPAAIWFSAFVKAGFLVIPFLLIIKGIGMGFTAVTLGASYGLNKVLYLFCIMFLQNFILIFVYIYLSKTGFKFIREKNFDLKRYFLSFLFSILFIITAVLIEIFINPIILT